MGSRVRPIDGPIDPNGNTFMSVVEPYWYLLSDWEADPGLPVTIPPVDLVTGNYLVGIEVSLCETSAGPGLPPCQVEPTATLTPTPTPDASVYNCTGSVVCPNQSNPDPICSLVVKQGTFISLYFDPYTAMNDPGSPAIVTEGKQVAPLAYWDTSGGDVLFIRGRDHNNEQVWGWTNTAGRVDWQHNTGGDIGLCQGNVPVVNQGNIPTLTPTPTPTGPSPTPTLSPTPTFTPSATPTLPCGNLDAQLLNYGVYVVGEATVDPCTSLGDHLRTEVFDGVQDIAQALNTKFPSAGNGNSVGAFKEIMNTEPDSQITPIAFVFIQRPLNLTCETFPGGVNASQTALALLDPTYTAHQAVIECDIDFGFNFIKNTAVHELGHNFTAVTGGNGQWLDQSAGIKTYFGYMRYPTWPLEKPDGSVNRNIDVRDREFIRVYGYRPDLGQGDPEDWLRGTAGWGSSPDLKTSQVACDFQQNVVDDVDQITTLEVDEAAADMFLNWVYQAFADVDWHPSGGCRLPDSLIEDDIENESGAPGITRSEWMDYLLTQIGQYKQWN